MITWIQYISKTPHILFQGCVICYCWRNSHSNLPFSFFLVHPSFHPFGNVKFCSRCASVMKLRTSPYKSVSFFVLRCHNQSDVAYLYGIVLSSHRVFLYPLYSFLGFFLIEKIYKLMEKGWKSMTCYVRLYVIMVIKFNLVWSDTMGDFLRSYNTELLDQ